MAQAQVVAFVIVDEVGPGFAGFADPSSSAWRAAAAEFAAAVSVAAEAAAEADEGFGSGSGFDLTYLLPSAEKTAADCWWLEPLADRSLAP